MVNYSFTEPFSQKFEVLNQLGDAINPKLARKSDIGNRTRIKISKFEKRVLRSQYVYLKVSINSYFDLFITICT